MGVQTLKNAVLIATAVVAAVIIVQGAGSSATPLESHASAVTIASSISHDTTTSAPAALFPSKSSTASTGSATGATASSTSAASSAAAGTTSTGASTAATTASASTTASTSAPQSYSSAPATYTAPAPAPPATPVSTPACPSAIGGSTAGAPGASDAEGVPGTTTADINSFATEYNALRVADCLAPVPLANIRYSDCLQQRLWWMADDPSTNPLSAWGHTGTAVRSDGVPIVGCDGDLAGGTGYTGASVAQAWWVSLDHRASLYQPSYTGSLANVCIAFAISHGGINVPLPNEPYSFTRSAAYWYNC
jgi:hypothetical protein